MAMYDDILKQMQSSFTGMSPQKMGQPGGFMKPNFNFNYKTDDDPFGGGGGSGGGSGGGDGDGDGNPGGGSTPGSGSPNYGPTTYGGQYGSQFSSIEDILSSIGESGYNLTNPASQLGFSQYADLFGQFDIAGYYDAQQSLMDRESRLLGEIGQQFQAGTESMQANLQDSLLKMMGQESTTGLVGGRQAERRRLTREAGQQNLLQLGQQTQSKYAGAQESIGNQMGVLEGSLMDFINSQSQIALNILSSGGEKDKGAGTESGYTGYTNIPRGSSMTAQQLEQYSGMFGDLGNAIQAFQYFVSQAHSNLTDSHLQQLAYDIYNMYQQMDESGGT